ncbi:MAG: 50S ribosomal protein L13 [Phycisphaerales bacterium]|nr:50S ribosomal protein L13 [Phycisphaerales bacterium]
MTMRRDTYLATPQTVPAKTWRLVDATDVSLGRLAVDVANVLMGKHRPEYTPHVDCGDYVVVINGNKVGLTGRKAEQSMKQRYTSHPGGLKEESYGSLRERKPEKLIEDAVRRMMPKNRLSRHMLTKLKVYPGSEHPHASQQPVKMEV